MPEELSLVNLTANIFVYLEGATLMLPDLATTHTKWVIQPGAPRLDLVHWLVQVKLKWRWEVTRVGRFVCLLRIRVVMG